jgi:hypothetical protein
MRELPATPIINNAATKTAPLQKLGFRDEVIGFTERTSLRRGPEQELLPAAHGSFHAFTMVSSTAASA